MTTRQRSTLWTLLSLSVVGMVLAAYVVGYFWLGLRARVYEGTGTPKVISIRPLPGGKAIVVRQFRGGWPTTIYQPLAKIESATTGTEVRLVRIADARASTVRPLR